MIKELIVHLGDTKTGSTALQSVLRAGRFKLPGQQTLLYPGSSLNQNDLAQCLSRRKQAGKIAKRYGTLAERLRKSNADYAVVSAEHFQSADPESLQKAIAGHLPEFEGQVRLIAYVRPHAEKLLSSFSEQVKLGSDPGSLEEHFDHTARQARLDYTPRFQAWRDVFGDRFALRPFVRSQLHKQDISEDFFRWLTGGEEAEVTPAPAVNESLTVGQIALMRCFGAALVMKGRRGGMGSGRAGCCRAMAQAMRSAGLGRDSGRLHLPDGLVDRIVARYSADAAALDAAFFRGTPMTDALTRMPERLTGPAQPLDADSYFPAEAVAAVRGQAALLSSLAKHNPKSFKALSKDLHLAARRLPAAVRG